MSRKIKYNYLGEDLTNVTIKLLDPSYGTVDKDNIPHVDWGIPDDKCDKDGFDKTFRPIRGSKEYIIKDYIIPKGTIICRYGSEFGSFTTNIGTPYEELGLPYVKETVEYHEYQVSKDIHVECHVSYGKVAPKFLSDGGGIQYLHRQKIKDELVDCLKEVFSWKK